MTRAFDNAIPPFCCGLFTICPFMYITVEPPPSRFMALVHPKDFIRFASSIRVKPIELPSLPSAATRIKSLSLVYPIAVLGFLPPIYILLYHHEPIMKDLDHLE